MKKIIAYILLFLWLFVIFYLSNQSGTISGGESSNMLYHIFDFIYDIFSISKTNLSSFIEIIHNPVRECMHCLEYLILGILMMSVLKQNDSSKNAIWISIMFCFIYAASDEIHQIFVPGRTFEYLDITLDTLGSILGSIIGFQIFFRKNVQK